MSSPNRRRLIRFCILRTKQCPYCGNNICYITKDNTYKCSNSECNNNENLIQDNKQNKENTDYTI